ncbi:mucin-2-like [Sabethes cyaneus]|uniref:mucin-2-like n=1 Tax=Sabethes cyaneus TaxID=53552 RepID=UPI00237E881F|nr:mucin-2-like [Sabethes cyaneus]
MLKLFLLLFCVGLTFAQECSVCPVGVCHPNPACPANDNASDPKKLPHADCGKFYKCSLGNACEMSCPAGLHWSVTANRCEWPHIACCDKTIECRPCCDTPATTPTTVITTPTTPITTPTTPITTPTTPITTPTTPLPTPDDPVCIIDARCPANDNPFNPLLLPHESDCTLFYKCDFGRRCPKSCPPGEHFSVALQRCDWPNIACCDPRIPCTTTPPVPAPTTVATPAPPAVQCIPDARCPANDNPMNPLLLPHETDCGLFYKCDTGERCLKTCPPGEHFSVALQRCDWPNIACCNPAIPCTTTPIAPAPPIPTPAPPAAQCIPDARCPANDNPMNPLLLPHETDCGQFYKCDSGERCLKTCPLGEHFSVALQRCDWPNIACCNPAIPCTSTPGTPSPPVVPTPAPPAASCTPDARCPANDNPLNPLLLPHETNCGQFYKCDSGQRCLVACPLGEHFSAALQRCDWPNIACCNPQIGCVATANPIPTTNSPVGTSCVFDARCPATDDPMNPRLLQHENDCSLFYKCDLGRRCLMQCKTGEHFSSALQRCEWPNYACCDARLPCETAPNMNDPCYPGVCETPICYADSGCPVQDNPLNPIHLRNPASCSSFYKCQRGQACLVECPIGQHWSQALQRCEWPNVACCSPAVECCLQCIEDRRRELGRLFGIKMYN